MSAVKSKITKSKIELLTIGQKLWDTEITGLYVHKQKTKTCFYYKYRVQKEQRLSNLGQAGSISLDDVRTKARQYYVLSKDGIDPVSYLENEARKINEASLHQNYTIADAYADWEKHVKPQLKKSSLAEWTYYGRYIKPEFGHKRLDEISVSEMNEFHQSIEKKYAANRSIKILKKLYNVAITLDKYEGKMPFAAVKLHREQRRRRHLTDNEPQRLYNALEKYKLKGEEEFKACACVMLYLLTSARKREWLDTPKDWVNLDNGILSLPNTKNGEPDDKILPSAAIEILKELFAKYPDSHWVFPSPKNKGTKSDDKGRSLENIKRHWLAIRELAGLDDFRLHDLRRSFASFALSTGYNLHQIGEILNHKNVQTTKGYAYLVNSDRTKATQNISEEILKRMKGEIT